MKRFPTVIGTLLMLTVMCMPAMGADKVIERSRKKAPDWIGENSSGFITIVVERPSLNEAMREAEVELARRIISAVALNITHSTSAEASDEWTDNTNRYLESFTSKTETAAAKLPFLKGVSLSKATDSFWEKREEKGTKRNYVVYSVRYPLSERELADMTAEFEKTDREKYRELQSLRAGLPDVDSSDRIQDALGRLTALEEYFFDAVRIKETKALAANYRELYKGLTLDGEFQKDARKLTCRVLLKGKPFKVTAMPKLSSNCASQLSATHSADSYSFSVTYSDEDCLANEENWIEVSLRLKDARLVKKFFFKVIREEED